MRDTRQFYDDYWRWRREQGYLNAAVPERLRAALRLLAMERQPIRRLLDVGCGEGTLGRLLREQAGRDLELVGSDISPRALELAAAHYDQVHQVNVEQEALRERLGAQPFDAIVSLEVLEHLFAPRALLQQLHELLAPGGKLVVSFPNIAWWRYRVTLLAGHYPEEYHIFDAVEHVQQFTLHSFRRLLDESGYRITAIDGDFLQPAGVRHLPRAIRRALNRRFPNLFGYQIVVSACPR
jgi:2-polyprenyl-3-methyl-5-hydroxy-6-metoxy-1,4-benzoquinol methylase